MAGGVGRDVVGVVLAVVILAGAGGAAGATATPAATDPGLVGSEASDADLAGPSSSGATQTGAPATDATVTRISVLPNGTAVWTVEIRTLLANDTDLEAYERFQERFRSDTDAYLGSFRDRMTRLVDRAGNVTGREMAARNFTAGTAVEQAPRRWGVVTYRFRWTGFAQVRDGTLVVGDVFESGYYLAGSDSLVVEAPEGYAVREVVPEPTAGGDRTVRWAGPIDFGDGRPSVRMSPEATTTATTPTTTAGTTDGSGGDGDPGDGGGPGDGGNGENPGSGSGGVGLVPAVLLVAALLVVGLGTYAVLGGRGDAADTGTGGGTDGHEAVPNGEGGATGGGSAGGQSGTGDGASGDGADDADGDDGVPVAGEELLTDEERVVDLLERNGGRMRQTDVADELDWSAPKTSRVLSSMADDGEVQKLRLGNQNVIDLPDDD